MEHGFVPRVKHHVVCELILKGRRGGIRYVRMVGMACGITLNSPLRAPPQQKKKKKKKGAFQP